MASRLTIVPSATADILDTETTAPLLAQGTRRGFLHQPCMVRSAARLLCLAAMELHLYTTELDHLEELLVMTMRIDQLRGLGTGSKTLPSLDPGPARIPLDRPN